MKPVNNRIIVRVNLSQKDKMIIDGVELSTATKFDSNYRERSPVIAEVVTGNHFLKTGDYIVAHHNHFYHPSPYHLEDDLYSIPFNKTIFAKVGKKGNLTPICGNMFGERVLMPAMLDMPPQYQQTYIDRLLITDNGKCPYNKGTVILCRPNAPYDIVYNWKGEEKRVTKVPVGQVVGYLLKK